MMAGYSRKSRLADAARHPALGGDPKPECPLEIRATGCDQIIARIATSCRFGIVLVGRARRFCLRRAEYRLGDFDLRMARPPRQRLDRTPILVAQVKVEARQNYFRHATPQVRDQADALDQLAPIDGRHQAHAGDDVADRHIHRTLALLFVMDDGIGRAALGGQATAQPGERRQHLRVLVAQPLD